MIYGSVCSGIEAATSAWHPLGWEPAFFSEIDAFPRAVLSHHYPKVSHMKRKEHVEGRKHCARCDRWQGLEAYHANARNWDRLHAHCRDCMRAQAGDRYGRKGDAIRAQAKAWRAANPDKRKDMALKRKFGITLAFYREMESGQGGLCAICHLATDLHVDHCHATGAIRGLLCMPCNTAIGHLADDPERIRRAASYIEASR